MKPQFREVAQYYYERNEIVRDTLKIASIPMEDAYLVKKALQNPHKLDSKIVSWRAESELQFSRHLLRKEYKIIRKIHGRLAKLTNRPGDCREWKELSEEEKRDRLRATVVRARKSNDPQPTRPRPPIALRHNPSKEERAIMELDLAIQALEEQQEKEKIICAMLEIHAKCHGCPTERSKDEDNRIGAKWCAARAGRAVKAKARNDRLLREIEAMKAQATSKGKDISGLNYDPLTVSINKVEKIEMEKRYTREYADRWARQKVSFDFQVIEIGF